MNSSVKNVLLFAVMAGLIVFVGQYQSWNLALSILNLCIISAIMSLGVNIQWGYAGLFNVGVMGFAALGGLAAMIISVSPVPEAWSAGGVGVLIALFILVATIVAAVFGYRKMSALTKNRCRPSHNRYRKSESCLNRLPGWVGFTDYFGLADRWNIRRCCGLGCWKNHVRAAHRLFGHSYIRYL